jgi:hypothetical protein
MLQPTGPHPGGGPPPEEPSTRVAAGRDILRDTSRVPQDGHFTSSASDRRMTSSSNPFPHRLQEYS